ncbi:hypothetical protein F4779DRAFT_643476 [Xylariaceae sp. FL0662B]|nr:hypothetical protein F4779DRAFT_643476 [Xylariaceae sp. FL0662B]
MEGQNKRPAEALEGSLRDESGMNPRKQIKHEHSDNQVMELLSKEASSYGEQPHETYFQHTDSKLSLGHDTGVLDMEYSATADDTPSNSNRVSSFNNDASSSKDTLERAGHLHDRKVEALHAHIQDPTQKINTMEMMTATTQMSISDTIARQENQKLISELRETRATLAKTEEALTEKSQQCQEMQGKLAEAVAEKNQRCREILLKWQEAENHLLRLKRSQGAATDSADHINQDAVIKAWKSLKYRIDNLVKIKFRGMPLRVATRREPKEYFSHMVENQDDFLKNGNLKGYFLEAAIWRKVLDEILLVPASVFNKEAGRTILCVQQQALGALPQFDTNPVEALENYHLWRTHTGQALYKIYGNSWKNEEARKKWVEVARQLAEFFCRYSSQPAENELTEDFEGIIRMAANLAALLARSRAHYVLCMAEHTDSQNMYGFNYDETWMKVERDGSEYEEVELVISPAVFKYGDENGEYYDRREVLVKARVIY